MEYHDLVKILKDFSPGVIVDALIDAKSEEEMEKITHDLNEQFGTDE